MLGTVLLNMLLLGNFLGPMIELPSYTWKLISLSPALLCALGGVPFLDGPFPLLMLSLASSLMRADTWYSPLSLATLYCRLNRFMKRVTRVL